MTGSGVDTESGEWTPAFKGQRTPFTKGNAAARRHGARAPRVYGPLAEKIEAELRVSAQPPWIVHPVMQPILREYAVRRAQAQLLADYLDNVTCWPFCMCYSCEAEDDATKWRMYPRRKGAAEAYWRATTRCHFLLRDLGASPYDQATAPDSALWLQAAADMGYTRRKPPRGQRPPVRLP